MVLLNAVKEDKEIEEEAQLAANLALDGDAGKESHSLCNRGTADCRRRFAVSEEDQLDRSGLVTLLKDYRRLMRLRSYSMV